MECYAIFKYEQDSLSLGVMSFLVLLRDHEIVFRQYIEDHHWCVEFDIPVVDRVSIVFHSTTEFGRMCELDHMCSIAFAFMDTLSEVDRFHLEREVIMSLRDQERL